jgi:hypothetical protein
VQFWVKDIKVGFSNVNAKAEGIEGRSAPLFWQRLVNAGRSRRSSAATQSFAAVLADKRAPPSLAE